MFWRIFLNLCVNNNISPNAVAKELNIASGAVTKWKNGSTPHNTTLLKIAEYFNVSTEYLLGQPEKEKTPGTGSINAVTAFDTITMAVTKEEAEIIQAYRSYPEVGKRIVRRTLGLEGISPDAATAAYGGKDTQVGKFEE